MRGYKRAPKKEILPDLKFNSVEIAGFVNKIMIGGKKETARRIFYRALDIASTQLKVNPLDLFEGAVENVAPLVEVRPRRIGGATYQVPMEVNKGRARTLAERWLISAAREKQGKPMEVFLAEELADAYQNKGQAVSRKEQLHKLAEQNKAFAHYARF